jgi:hypothetical protein
MPKNVRARARRPDVRGPKPGPGRDHPAPTTSSSRADVPSTGAALAARMVGDEGKVTSVELDPVLVAAARANLAACGRVTVLHGMG